MQDVVDRTFMGFLGVTIGCARCHDHMFDLIRQKEYYQVRAVFEPHQVRIDRVPGQADTKKDGLARAYDADLGVKTVMYLRGDERTPDKEALKPGVPEALGGQFSAIGPVNLPLTAYTPERRDFIVRELLGESEMAMIKAREALSPARVDAVGPATAVPRGIWSLGFGIWDLGFFGPVQG